MEISFKGKRALVTGGSRGIGRAIVIALAKGGAEVIALGTSQADLDSLKQEVPTVLTKNVDLSNWDATREIVQGVGVVDLLVNNAGVARIGPFLETKPEDFDFIMNVNVKAVLNVSQVIAKGMLDSGKGGSIVNVSSTASFLALKEHINYCASKGALDMMTKVMALELGPKIRVNSVNPTVVMTDMGRYAWSDPKKSQPMLDRIPLDRFVEIEEVVNAVLFLLSDQASMVNGVLLPVDGGFHTH